jgi:glycosyltransferase involved in cell wall biosynthesis
MQAEFPLVTCLCLTKNRREWLPKAIDCFLKQEYAPRELLIIADKIEDVRGLLPDRPGYVRAFLQPGTVGHKRNVGCVLARSELIALFDDDDYSAPGRLTQQVAQLKATKKAATGFHAMKFTDGENWWLYRGGESTVIASSLCFRRTLWEKNRFAEMNCGQDEIFADQAAAKRELGPLPDGDLMYATIHPGNTSPRDPARNNAFVRLEGFEWKDGPR